MARLSCAIIIVSKMKHERASMSTKEQICETAYRLFKEKGYDNVTVDDICKESGIAKTTFYYHLDSKEDTIYPFYKLVFDALAQKMDLILAADTYWKQLVISYFALVKESDSLGYDMTGKLYIANINENKRSIEFGEQLDKTFIAIIKNAQKAGQIRNPKPADELYRAVGYSYIGLEVFWCIYKDEFDRDNAVMSTLETIFDVDPDYKVSYAEIMDDALDDLNIRESGGGN